MDFDLSDEQKMLQEQTRRLLNEHDTLKSLRMLKAKGESWDRALWKKTADMGLLGAAIPESFGGLGLEFVNSCLVAGEMGRCIAPLPFFSSICLAAEAIKLAGSEKQKAQWLPRLASGEVIGTFAFTEHRGDPNAAQITTEFRDGKLTGRKLAVADAGLAQICIVVTYRSGKLTLALVELDQPAVMRIPLDGFDLFRPHETIEFENAEASILEAEDAERAISRLCDMAAVACAFEQIGGADACLWMARDYAMQRVAFGRSIASYQAIKHKLADLYVLIELARSNAYFAAWAVESDAKQLPAAAATARLAATEAYECAARENLQTHGGIGYTWDADCHFHYRRARLLALGLGSSEMWSNRLLDNIASRKSSGEAL